MAPAMPCKIMKMNCGSSTSNKIKTRLACILEGDESKRLRVGDSLPKYHEDHIAGKGDTSLQQYNFGTQIYSYASSNEDSRNKKQQWIKNGKKLEKIPAWNLTKVRSKKEVIDEARTRGAKVHFASLMDMCTFKECWIGDKAHQKHKGRVVLRGDIVKDDSGSYAVFTEQGSSASQMTAAKVMDIISRLPRWNGQAADTVSAYTQVKNGRCSQIIENSKIGVSRTFGFVYHDTNGQNHGPLWKTQLFPLDRNLYGHLLARLLWWKAIRENPIQTRLGENFQIKNVSSYTVKKDYSSPVYVDDIKLAGKEQNIDPMWKVLNQEVDLGEPTSFLDHVYMRCTQRQSEISKDIVDNHRTMFESRISAGGLEKLPFPQNLRISSWSYDMAGHAKKWVERYCELANKTTDQLSQGISSMQWWTTTSKEEEMKYVGELSNTCSQNSF